MKNNIAQAYISRYESEDFKNDYAYYLLENFGNNEGDIINRIINLFNVSNYETEKYLKNWHVIDRADARKIYDFLYENLESFVRPFSSYYVGYTSLESIAFGEQEEQLDGIWNHRTKKNYSLNYLKKVFEAEGYFVNDRGYAYYNLDGGLHVDLLGNIELLDGFLAELKEKETQVN